MRYQITGRSMTLSEELKNRVTTKLGRIEKLFPEDTEAAITLTVEKLNHIVEVTIPLKKRLLRAEVSSFDMFAAIDEVVDVLEKQMIKYKSRLRTRARQDSSFRDEFQHMTLEGEGLTEAEEAEGSILLERTKRFPLKPMDAEEAVLEMELLGHNFFVFRSGDTDEVNVVYKRKNGTYGLIEPQY